MLGPGVGSDYGKKRVRVLALETPRCTLEWGVGRCAPRSSLIEGFEDATEWIAHGDASGIAADTTDPVSGSSATTWNKGTAATGYGGIEKTYSQPLDLTPWSRLRVVVRIPAAELAKILRIRVYLDESTSFTDYSGFDFTGLQAGDNFLTIALASPTFSAGTPTLEAVQRIIILAYTTTATDALTGIGADDLRGLGTPVAPCYKTTGTCQVPGIYANHNVLGYDYFADQGSPRGTPGHKLVIGWEESVGRIGTKGLGSHSTVRVTLADPLHDDQGLDPYWESRATRQGNQIAKFVERHKYLQGKTALVYEGWANSDGTAPALSEMTARRYRVDRRPDADDGMGRITLADPLGAVELGSSPEDVQSALRTAVDATTDTWELEDAEDAAGFPTGDFWVACQDEIVHVASRSSTTLTITTVDGERNEARTAAASHASGEGVSLVDYYAGPVDTVLQTILNAAGLEDGILDLSGWAAEVALFAPEYELEVWIRKSTRRSLLLQDFTENLNLLLWWDPEQQKVRIRFGRPLAPGESFVEIDDRKHTDASSPTTHDPQVDLQYTRVRVYHQVRDWSQDLRKPESYRRKLTYVSGDAESALQRGEQDLHEVFNYWMPRALEEEAKANAFRSLASSSDAPDLIRCVVPAWIAEQVGWGSLVRFTSTRRQDEDGNPKVLETVCVRKARRGDSELWALELLETTVFGRWWWWADDDAEDYPGSVEYAHWANDAEQMPDGTPGYSLI